MSFSIAVFSTALLHSAACDDFLTKVSEPVEVAITPIAGTTLNGALVPADSRTRGQDYAIGPFRYRGYGISQKSNDPRFRGIVAGPTQRVHHRCNYVLNAPGAWNAYDADLSGRWVLFSQAATLDLGPGALAAVKSGTIPMVDGYIAAGSWPVHIGHQQFFVGAMHRDSSQDETLIVAFSRGPALTRTIELARIPIRLEAIAILPFMHESGFAVSLAGISSDGSLNDIVLELDNVAASNISGELGLK